MFKYHQTYLDTVGEVTLPLDAVTLNGSVFENNK